MKIFFPNTVLMLIGILTANISANAQLYEVSLDEKIRQSSLIVEGRVSERESYRAPDGRIYTANKIDVSTLLKGGNRDLCLTVTTWGGSVGDEEQTWTHMLTLEIGSQGIFFLEPSRVPGIRAGGCPTPTYDVYSGVQGFLEFSQNQGNKAWVASEPFHVYEDISEQLFSRIEQFTGQRPEQIGVASMEIRTGVRYAFKNITFDGTWVNFDIFINSLLGDKKLHQSGIAFGYNQSFCGGYIVANNNLQLQANGISGNSVYNLTQTDLASQKAKIEITTVGSVTSLSTITTTEQLLAKGKLKVLNPFADPDIVYDIAEVAGLNKYYGTDGQVYPFDTVIVEGFWHTGGVCTPVIEDISPDTVTGGTGQIVTIKGQCFGEFMPNFCWVEFTDAAKGITVPVEFMEPIYGDYRCGGAIYCWTDTLIELQVPAVAKIPSMIGDSASLTNYAGTGFVNVFNADGEMGTSPTKLVVKYSAENSFTKANQTPEHTSLRRTLWNKNGEGGMTITFSQAFLDDANAHASFIRALNTWKCATRVNFNIDPVHPNTDGDVCLVDWGPLPIGTNSVWGRTLNYGTKCGQGQTIIKSQLKKFDMVFNDAAPFYKLEDLAGFDATMVDFQSNALHEIGHAHLLNHTNHEEMVMYAKLGLGQHRRVLTPWDEEGGDHIMSISTQASPGSNCKPPMTFADTTGLDCMPNAVSWTSNEIDLFLTYPNPVNGEVHFKIVCGEVANRHLVLEIWGFNGQLSRKEFVSTSGDEKEGKLDMSYLSQGIYMICLKSEDRLLAVNKIVKQ